MGVGQGRPWVRKYGVQDQGCGGVGKEGVESVCGGLVRAGAKGELRSTGRFGGIGVGGASR